LVELRALRESISTGRASTPEVKEDQYWIRLKGRALGPIGKLELIELFSSGKIELATPVAPDAENGSRVFKALVDEIPMLQRIARSREGII